MAGSLAALVVNKILSSYLQPVSGSNFSLGLLSGNIALKRLQLKPDVLAKYEAPADIREAFLENIEINIPWKNILNQPVKATVESLFVVVRARGEEQMALEDRIKRFMETRTFLLQIFSLFGLDSVNVEAAKAALEPPVASNPTGFLRYVMRIVDNIQVEVKNIHVRYEDDVSGISRDDSVPSRVFALGVTLGSVTINTVNEQGEPAYMMEFAPVNKRLIAAKNIAVYLNTSNGSAEALDLDGIKQLIYSEVNLPNNQYVLSPSSLEVELSMDRSANLNTPKLNLAVRAPDLNLGLLNAQYNSILNAVTHYTAYFARLQNIKNKPQDRSPKELWRFAMVSVREKVRREVQTWVWDTWIARKEDRIKYFNLHRRRFYGCSLTAEDKSEIERIEKEFTFQEVLLWRKVASASVQVDQQAGRIEQRNILMKQPPTVRMSLFGAGFSIVVLILFFILYAYLGWAITAALMGGGGLFSFRQYKDQIERFRLLMTSPIQIPHSTAPYVSFNPVGQTESKVPEYATLRVDAKVGDLKVRLLKGDNSPLVDLELGQVEGEVITRAASLDVSATIYKLNLSEYHTLENKKTYALKPIVPEDNPDAKFWTFKFAQNPLDKKGVDMFVGLQSLPLQLLVSVPAIFRILDYFTPDANQTEVKSIVRQTAAEAVHRARASLKYAILRRAVLVLDVNIEAPTILISERIKADGNEGVPDGSVLVLDFGDLKLSSAPKRPESDEVFKDPKAAEEYLFDRYSVQLSNVNGILSNKGSRWTEDVRSQDKKNFVIRKFDLGLDVDVCTSPALELPRARLTGLLSPFKALISARRLGSLLRIVNSMMPALGSPAPARKPRGVVDKAVVERVYAEPLNDETVPLVRIITGSFQIARVTAVLAQDAKDQDDETPIRLLEVNLTNLTAEIDQTTKSGDIKARMHSLNVKDCATSRKLKSGDKIDPLSKWMVNSKDASELIDVELMITPKNSNKYTGTANAVNVTIGDIEANLNRSLLGRMLREVNKLNAVVAETMPRAPAPEPQEELSESLVQFMPVLSEAPKDYTAKVRTQISGIIARLLRDGAPVITASLNNTFVNVEVRADGALRTGGHVGALDVDYLNLDPSSPWTKIMTIKDERVVAFEYSTAKSYDGVDFDMAVSASLGAVRIVFLQKFLADVIGYFNGMTRTLNASALEPPSSPSVAATNAQPAPPAKPTKIKLAFSIGNPTVVVPKSSTHKDHLVLSLGRIKVDNKFSKGAGALLDVMAVEVSGLNLESVIDGDKPGRLHLIGQTKLGVNIKRALIVEKKIDPDIGIDINIDPIEMCFDMLHTEALAGLLVGNLREKPAETDVEIDDFAGPAPVEPAPEPAPGKTTATDALSPRTTDRISRAEEALSFSVLDAGGVAETAVTDNMRLAVRLSKLDIVVNNSESKALIGLDFKGLETTVVMKSDKSMKVSALLDNIELSNLAASENNFRHVIAKALEEKLFRVTYELSAQGNTDISVNWNKAMFFILPGTVISWKNEFEKPVQSILAILNPPNQSAPPSHSASETVPAVVASPTPDAAPNQGRLRLLLALSSPQINVLKNETASKSRAFSLNIGETTVVYEMSQHEGMRVNVQIGKFRFGKNMVFANTLEQKEEIDILQPINGKVAFEQKNGNSSVTAEMATVDTILSFKDLQLLKAVMTNFNPLIKSFQPPELTPEEQAEADAKAILDEDTLNESMTETDGDTTSDFSTLSGSRELPKTDSNKSIGKAPHSRKSSQKQIEGSNAAGQADVASAGPPAEAKPQDNKPITEMKAKAVISGLRFGLIDDRFKGGFFVPLIRAHIEPVAVTATVHSDNGTTAAVETNDIAADSYNNQLAGWEPVLEPWKFVVAYQQTPKMQQINVLSPDPDHILNFNVTKTMIDTVFDVTDILAGANEGDDTDLASEALELDVADKVPKKKKKPLAQSRPHAVRPFVLRNETGLPISYALQSSSSNKTLGVGESAALVLRTGSRRDIMSQTFESRIKLFVSGFEAQPVNLLLNKVQCHFTALVHKDSSDPQLLVTEVIENAEGGKEIIARGDYKIVNNTLMKIHFSTYNTSPDEPDAVKDFIMEPSETYSCPLRLGKNRTLRVKPEGCDWSDPVDLKHSAHEVLIKCKSADSTWMCFALIDVVRGLDVTVTLAPPLCLQNFLTVGLEYQLSDSKTKAAVGNGNIEEAKDVTLHKIPWLDEHLLLSIRIPGFDWSAPVPFLESMKLFKSNEVSEDSVRTVKLNLNDPRGHPLRLRADISRLSKGSAFRVAIYARYWIVNNTGLHLSYKVDAGDKNLAPGQQVGDQDFHGLPSDQQQWYPHLKSDKEDIKTNSRGYLYYGEKTLSYRVGNSSWAKEQKLGAGNQGSVELEDKHSNRKYMFTMSVYPAPARFWRTGIVRFFPNYTLVNQTKKTILWRQEGIPETDPNVQKIPPGAQIPLHWPSHKLPAEMRIRFEDAKHTSWSAPFTVASVGRYPVKTRHMSGAREESPADYDFVSLHIREKPGVSTFIAFEDEPEETFVRVKNNSRFSLMLRESEPSSVNSATEIGGNMKKLLSSDAEDSLGPVVRLGPHGSVPMAWSDPQQNDPAIVLFMTDDHGKEHKRVIKINQLKEHESIKVGKKQFLRMSVKAYGKSKVLSIRESHRRHKEENSEKIVELEEEKDKLKFVLELSGVGVSIVDPMPQELMYLRISDIKLAYINSNIQQTVELKIGGFQLDNDLYLTPFPVVMSSPPVPDKPFFHVSLVRDMKYSDFFCFRYFAVAMQKLSVEVDQAFLVKTVSWSTFITNHMAKRSRGTVERNLLAGTDETIPSITADELSSPDAFYFDIFHINPMEIDISFSPSRNFDATNLEPGAAELLVKLGPYLTPVSEAPITLGGMLVENAFSSRPEFIQNVTTHYTRQFISQAFKLLGSFDFLGNPVSMISGLGSGVYTFVHEPAKAIVESPGDFGISVAKGTGALLKGTLGGALNMAGKLVNNVAKVGEMLTMDDEYRRQREITKAKKARHAGEGFAMGVKEFGSGLFHGVTGLISQPIKGAKKEGLKGLGKGLGKGLLGVVFKPTVGAVDLFTRTTEGIKNTVGGDVEKLRIRLPRAFGPDQLLTIYDEEPAAGQLVLKTLEKGEFRDQVYVWHALIGKDEQLCILVTNNKIFLLEHNKVTGKVLNLSELWGVEWLAKIRGLSEEVNVNEKGKVTLKQIGEIKGHFHQLAGPGATFTSAKKGSELFIKCVSQEEGLVVASKLKSLILRSSTTSLDANLRSIKRKYALMAKQSSTRRLTTAEPSKKDKYTEKEEKKAEKEREKAEKQAEKEREKAEKEKEKQAKKDKRKSFDLSASQEAQTTPTKDEKKASRKTITLDGNPLPDDDESSTKESKKEKRRSGLFRSLTDKFTPTKKDKSKDKENDGLDASEALEESESQVPLSTEEKKMLGNVLAPKRKSRKSVGEADATVSTDNDNTLSPDKQLGGLLAPKRKSRKSVGEGDAPSVSASSTPEKHLGGTLAPKRESDKHLGGSLAPKRKSSKNIDQPGTASADVAILAAAASAAPAYHGDLEIQVSKFLSKKWRPRHAELLGDGLVLMSAKNYSKKKERVLLDGGLLKVGPDDKQFTISNANSKVVYQFKCPTSESRAEWVNALRTAGFALAM